MPRNASHLVVAPLMVIALVCSAALRVSAARRTDAADAGISASIVNLRVSRLRERDALGVRARGCHSCNVSM